MTVVLADLALLQRDGTRPREMAIATVVAEIGHTGNASVVVEESV